MSKDAPADARKSRLAEALRQNLKRRKAQIRARARSEAEAGGAGEGAAANPPQSAVKEP